MRLRGSRKLVCDARLGFVEALLLQSQRQFLIGHIGAFEFCLEMSRDAFSPFLFAFANAIPLLFSLRANATADVSP